MKTAKIPKRFYGFREEMFGYEEPYEEFKNCTCGIKHQDMNLDIKKVTSRHYEILVNWDCELFKDFYSQAEYQATVFGDESYIDTGVLSSAKATVRALDKTK